MEAVFRRKRQGVDGLETCIFRREDEEKFVVGRRVAPRICPYRCNRTEGERQESREDPECDSEEPSQASTFREARMFRIVRTVIHVALSSFNWTPGCCT
jgi:hypothetical protein